MQVLGDRMMRGKDWAKGKRYLVHLDEEAVNEVPRVLWVKRCFVDLHPRGDEVLEFFHQVVDAIVSSWQILHDPRIHVI